MTLNLLVEDIPTGLLEEINYTKLTFGETINDSTPFSVSVPGQTEDPEGRTVRNPAAELLDPCRRLVHVQQGGEVLYSGIVRTNQDQGATFTAAGADLFSHLELNRLLRRDSPPLDYVDDDQFDIVTDMVENIMFNDGGSLGLTVRRIPTASGVIRTVSYNPWERKPYGEAIADLAEAENGFEWRITSVRNGQTIDRFLDIWYPRIGRTGPDTKIVWDEDSDIVITKRFVDGSRYANRVAVIGAGDGPTKTVGEATDPLDAYPRTDAVISKTDVTDTGFGNALAAGELARRRQMAETLSVKILHPETLGEWVIGDEIRVRSDRLALDGFYRIVSWSGTVDSTGFTVTAELVLGAPIGRPVRTPAVQQARDNRDATRAILKLGGR